MERRGRRRADDGLSKLVAETQKLVGQLVKENRALKVRNRQLSDEVARVSAGWDEIKKLARLAPRRKRPRA